MGLSERQIKRIRKRYLSGREVGLISKHREKISSNRIDPKLRAQAIQREEYSSFGLALVILSEETIRKWMTQDKVMEN